jgi:hypothetical protein
VKAWCLKLGETLGTSTMNGRMSSVALPAAAAAASFDASESALDELEEDLDFSSSEESSEDVDDGCACLRPVLIGTAPRLNPIVEPGVVPLATTAKPTHAHAITPKIVAPCRVGGEKCQRNQKKGGKCSVELLSRGQVAARER